MNDYERFEHDLAIGEARDNVLVLVVKSHVTLVQKLEVSIFPIIK